MLAKIRDQLNSGELTSVKLIKELIEKVEKKDNSIKAFLKLEKEAAIKEAEESDERRKNGKTLSEWDGIPIGIKDNIVIKGKTATCASKILENYISPFSATVIEKIHAAGMITVGHLNLDEFAMGSSTENSAFQITRNPLDLDRVPGGSSGGSSAAIAADYCLATLGSDTGGSIRQPAAFCGVVGLKPTYGTVSRFGLISFASSLDQIGPLTKTIEDNEIIYNLIKGYDQKDSTTIPNSSYNKSKIVKNPKIIRFKMEGVSSEMEKRLDDVENFLVKELGAQIVEADLPHQKYGIPVYHLTATSEASANLARFDGVGYGKRSKDASNLQELYEKTRTEGFGAEVKRRILLGTYALSSGYYNSFYSKAQQVRTLINRDYKEAFKKADFIILPTTPRKAFKIGEIADPVSMYLGDMLTVGASLAGIPSLSMPIEDGKLPAALQIQANYLQEPAIFDLAKKIEKEFS